MDSYDAVAAIGTGLKPWLMRDLIREVCCYALPHMYLLHRVDFDLRLQELMWQDLVEEGTTNHHHHMYFALGYPLQTPMITSLLLLSAKVNVGKSKGEMGWSIHREYGGIFDNGNRQRSLQWARTTTDNHCVLVASVLNSGQQTRLVIDTTTGKRVFDETSTPEHTLHCLWCTEEKSAACCAEHVHDRRGFLYMFLMSSQEVAKRPKDSPGSDYIAILAINAYLQDSKATPNKLVQMASHCIAAPYADWRCTSFAIDDLTPEETTLCHSVWTREQRGCGFQPSNCVLCTHTADGKLVHQTDVFQSEKNKNDNCYFMCQSSDSPTIHLYVPAPHHIIVVDRHSGAMVRLCLALPNLSRI